MPEYAELALKLFTVFKGIKSIVYSKELVIFGDNLASDYPALALVE